MYLKEYPRADAESDSWNYIENGRRGRGEEDEEEKRKANRAPGARGAIVNGFKPLI